MDIEVLGVVSVSKFAVEGDRGVQNGSCRVRLGGGEEYL